MTDDLTLRQLRYFLSAVEHGSFSAAATAEHVAQPSLSEQIRRLERQVGGRLFVRTNRQLQLTDLGRTMIGLAEQAVRSVDTLTDTLREARNLTGGTVSFGTFSSAHLYFLVPLISDFTRRHPQVRVRVIGLNSSSVAEAVRAGELEAGLVQLPIDDRGLVVTAPVLVDTVVYVSADPRRTREPISIEALAHADLILSEAHWGDDDPLRRSLTARARAAGVRVMPAIEVEFPAAALELAMAGVGDTLASSLVVRQPQYQGRCSYAALDPAFEERFAFVTRIGASPSPATRRFTELARTHAAALQAHASAAQRTSSR